MRSVVIGALLAAMAWSCGVETIVPDRSLTGGAGTTATGSGAAAVGSTATSGGGTAEGGGGALPACEDGGFVLVDSPGSDFFGVCDWGSRLTAGPVAYDRWSGPGKGKLTGVVEACEGEGPSSAFLLELPEVPLAAGTYTGATMVVGIYWASADSTVVTIDEVGRVGGYVKGTFSAILGQIDQGHRVTGEFCAVRVPDPPAE